jgi:ferredoxin
MTKIISIDQRRCQGHGTCYGFFPELFEPNDEGHSRLIEPSGEVPDGAEAHDAVFVCPERAISVQDQ